MPLFSAFTPYGHLAFSSQEPPGRAIYDAIQRMQGGNYSKDAGEEDPANARFYAWAMAAARVKLELRRAENEWDPATTLSLLPVHESAYGVPKQPGATIAERRAALVARTVLPRGGKFEAIDNGLTALLGSAYLQLIPNSQLLAADYDGWYESAGVTAATFPLDNVVPLFLQLNTRIDIVNVEFAFSYSNTDGSALTAGLPFGTSLVVDPGIHGLREAITVSSTAGSIGTSLATFAHPHEPGARMHSVFPAWGSARRHFVILVTDPVDSETRRKVNDFMRRIVTGGTTWTIADEATGGTIPGSTIPGVTPIISPPPI